MRLATLLIGLLLPACGQSTDGIATPAPMDLTRIVRRKMPNTALAAPAGFVPRPDIVTSVYKLAASSLYAAVRATAAAQPRTYQLVAYGDRLQVHFVVRSAVFGFPGLVAAQASPDGNGSTLILWSRSVYGRFDFGVNAKRVRTWLAALNARVAH